MQGAYDVHREGRLILDESKHGPTESSSVSPLSGTINPYSIHEAYTYNNLILDQYMAYQKHYHQHRTRRPQATHIISILNTSAS